MGIPEDAVKVFGSGGTNGTKGGVVMDPCTATMIAEGVDEADEATQIEAWQYLIDTGLAWQLQGFFGRQAKQLIEAGICHAA